MKYSDFNKIRKTCSVFVLLCLTSFSYGQSIEQSEPNKKNQPDVRINVNRELDNNGNVIRYDSTYSWSWSSDGSQDSQQFLMNDSNNAFFFKFFDNQDFQNEQFLNLLDNNIDSLYSRHFSDPYFENMEKQMQEMMHRQQQFMEELFGQPPIIPAPEENNDTNNFQQKAPPKKTSGTGIDI